MNLGRLPFYFLGALLVLSMIFLLSRSLFVDSFSTESKGDTSLVKFDSPSRLWSAAFDREPKFTTSVFRDDVGLPRVTMEGATLDEGGESYFVRLYHYHEQKLPPLESFFKDVLRAWKEKFPTLKVLSSSNSVFKGMPSLSYILVGQNLEMRGLIFSEEDYVYIIGWVGNVEDKQIDKQGDEHFQAFLKSFELTPEESLTP